MLCVDKACNTASLLNLRDHVKGHRGLTAGFRSINLNDSALRNAAQSQGDIQTQRPCRRSLNVHCIGGIPQLHDGPFAELLLNLAECSLQCLLFLFSLHSHKSYSPL